MVQAAISYDLDFGRRLSAVFQLSSDQVDHPISIARTRKVDVIFYLDSRPAVRISETPAMSTRPFVIEDRTVSGALMPVSMMCFLIVKECVSHINGQHQRPGANKRSACKENVIAGFAACNGFGIIG